ncbi:DUF899 family protein [Actinoplanes aureus]|uniref:DUF899 family protein n=1 Tax=Actinoplanes aureus TaxID=2792083 RepID=A0A931C9H4_9ACTN|nr:DUF899 family protein [Actinoplanes aureus]MBG0565880.1 DUF899 family protein [Actinoplanes aureus]
MPIPPRLGGLLRHLHARDTEYAVIARAPLAKLEKYRAKRGWRIQLYSSHGSDFNYDFHVTLDASVTPIQFNYRDADELRAAGMDWMLDTASQPMEQPGMSCFLRDDDQVFHAYSTFGRGTEQTGGAYGFLDMTALGRQEDWEQPAGRAGTGLQMTTVVPASTGGRRHHERHIASRTGSRASSS